MHQSTVPWAGRTWTECTTQLCTFTPSHTTCPLRVNGRAGAWSWAPFHCPVLSSPFPSRMLTVAPSCLPRKQHRAETTFPSTDLAFHLCLREEKISAFGCQHGPWAQAWGRPASRSATGRCRLPCERGKASVLCLISSSCGYFCSAFPPAVVPGWAQVQLDQIYLTPLSPCFSEVKLYLLEMDWRDSHSLSCFIEYITSLDLLSRKWNELTMSGWPSRKWITIL